MITTLLVLLVIVWSLFYRRTGLLALSFIFFSIFWRTLAAIYVHIVQPVYASELEQMIFSETAGNLFGCAMLLTIIPFLWIFKPQKVIARTVMRAQTSGSSGKGVDIGSIFFIVSLIFLLLLFGDMMLRGTIPFFAKMERYDYTSNIAGHFHVWLFEYGRLFVAMLGFFTFYPRVRGENFDARFVVIFMFILFYCFLTGHRFASLYIFLTHYLMPAAGILLLAESKKLPSKIRRGGIFSRFLETKTSWLLIFIFFTGLVLVALFNSYISVRNYGDKASLAFMERLLVQPIELWWYITEVPESDFSALNHNAWNLVFFDPVNANRNTGIQFLMIYALGYDRAYNLLEMGQHYAGGFPEIIISLVGKYLFWLVIPMLAILTALLVRSCVVSFINGRVLSYFFGIYLYMAISLVYTNGMINALFQWTFIVKVLVFFFVVIAEKTGVIRIPRRIRIS